MISNTYAYTLRQITRTPLLQIISTNKDIVSTVLSKDALQNFDSTDGPVHSSSISAPESYYQANSVRANAPTAIIVAKNRLDNDTPSTAPAAEISD